MRNIRAIANPTRHSSLGLPAMRRMADKHGRESELSAPAVSRETSVRWAAELVATPAEGQSRIQMLNPEVLSDVEAWLAKSRAAWLHCLGGLERELRAAGRRNESNPRRFSP